MHTMNYVQARWVLASESKPRRARQTQRGEKWHKDRDKMSIGGWRLSQGGVKHGRADGTGECGAPQLPSRSQGFD